MFSIQWTEGADGALFEFGSGGSLQKAPMWKNWFAIVTVVLEAIGDRS